MKTSPSQLFLYNTRSRKKEEFKALQPAQTTVYSCGPTVYDHVHIGNLSAFIMADTLRRVLSASGYDVKHVMNFTDVDDKTIRRSREKYPDLEPMDALRKLTEEYGSVFLKDMATIGNDVSALTFVKAADTKVIENMKQLIVWLYEHGFAYIADDGVYFSIDAYRKSGKVYGQLTEVNSSDTTEARIQNDEYDKESVHDFALWKVQKTGEPAWKFDLNGQSLNGRPGWHIECSAMSARSLGQPFDIHTGGIDLIFPHHENEIAQSTAGNENATYATVFMHNEHILVDGKKMSKSLGNFFTLEDIIAKEREPLAFRLLVLQSHYRNQTSFSWENLEAAAQRLKRWQTIASLRWQTYASSQGTTEKSADTELMSDTSAVHSILQASRDDLDTPQVLKIVDKTFDAFETGMITSTRKDSLVQILQLVDRILGLQLIASTPDITSDEKQLIHKREQARTVKDWQRSDELRDVLLKKCIGVRDTPHGSVWYRL